jgi:large subunit ribosomal protein L20
MRVKRGTASHKRHKKILEQTKGMQGLRRHSVKKAREALMRAWSCSDRDRRNRKRDFRALWIARIGAGAREHGLSYSQLMAGLGRHKIELDRKILADLAVSEPETFAKIVEKAKEE